MRWRPARTVGIATLVILAALVVCEVLGWPFLRQPAERAIAKAMQREVALGPGFRVHFLGPLRVHAESLRIGPPAWDAGRNEPSAFVDGAGLDLEIGWRALWRVYRDPLAPLHINEISARDLRARLLREADGRANWALAPSAQPAAETRATPLPTIDRLLVQAGHVVINDAVLRVDIDAHLRTDEGQGRASASASAASASASAPAGAALAGGLVIEGKGRYRDNKLSFHVQSDGALPLLAPDQSQGHVRLSFDAQAGTSQVRFAGSASDVFHLTGVDGDYMVSGPSLAAIGDAIGVTLPTTARFAIEGHLKKDGQAYQTEVRRLTVGTSRLDGRFAFDSAASPPMLTGQLNGQLALVDLAPAIGGGAKVAADNPPPPKGKVLPQKEFDIPTLRAMNAKVAVRLKRADFSTEVLRPFAPLDTTIVLQDGVLTLDDLNAQTAGGALRGMIQLDGRSTTPRFATDLRWSGVDLAQWVTTKNPSDEKARNGAAPQPYVTGKVLGTAKLKGAGRSTAAILSTLDGTLSTGVQKGSLSHLLIEAAGIDVAQAIGVLIEGDQPLRMDCALVHLTADKGAFTTDLGIIDTSVTTLLITGKASLVDESLGLKLTAKPKNISPLTLRAPINVTGSFADPSVLPELETVSIKLLAAALLATINPFAAVLPLVDLGDKNGAEGCEQAIAALKNAPKAN